MTDYTNMSLEELNKLKETLEQEKETLKTRRADVSLYQKLYEKYHTWGTYSYSELQYGKLCNHPEYYSKWRNTFFDKYNRLIHTGIYTRYDDEPMGLSIAEKREYRKKRPKEYKSIDEVNNLMTKCSYYEAYCEGVSTYDSLLRTPNNPKPQKLGKDLDTLPSILGYCDSVRKVDGRYQLHLIDPSGECTFPPFDITAKEAELALGRICVVTCACNFFYAEPKLWELQILPFTLTEKLGDYETDTVIIERDFPVKRATFRDYF